MIALNEEVVLGIAVGINLLIEELDQDQNLLLRVEIDPHHLREHVKNVVNRTKNQLEMWKNQKIRERINHHRRGQILIRVRVEINLGQDPGHPPEDEKN